MDWGDFLLMLASPDGGIDRFPRVTRNQARLSPTFGGVSHTIVHKLDEPAIYLSLSELQNPVARK